MASAVRFEYSILVSPFLVGHWRSAGMVTNSSQINALFLFGAKLSELEPFEVSFLSTPPGMVTI